MTAVKKMTDGEREAAAWFKSIRKMVAAYAKDATEEAERAIFESPLSVEVRGGWYVPNNPAEGRAAPAEYCILLSTGGPALRIIGDLSEHGEPTSAELQWQDWGTPWTPSRFYEQAQGAVLIAFAAHFYFGEG